MTNLLNIFPDNPIKRLSFYRKYGFPTGAIGDPAPIIRLEAFRKLGFTIDSLKDGDDEIRQEAFDYFKDKVKHKPLCFYPKDQYWFIFDVESIGLQGEGFAVACGIYQNGKELEYTVFSCPSAAAKGRSIDREWILENVHISDEDINCKDPIEVRDRFWNYWLYTKSNINYQNLLMAAECVWPVETNFLGQCFSDGIVAEKLIASPYPLIDICNWMAAAGMDPMKNYERLENELPVHHPLGDIRQSARLFQMSLNRLRINI